MLPTSEFFRVWRADLGTCHGLASDPTGRPSGLEVVTSGDPVDIQGFSGKIKTRDQTALHRLEIDFVQRDSPAGDEFLFVHALARYGKHGLSENLYKECS